MISKVVGAGVAFILAFALPAQGAKTLSVVTYGKGTFRLEDIEKAARVFRNIGVRVTAQRAIDHVGSRKSGTWVFVCTHPGVLEVTLNTRCQLMTERQFQDGMAEINR